MTEREKYDIAVRAKMCGGRRDDIVTLDDGSRWKLTGLTITPALDASATVRQAAFSDTEN
jgi:hypothetical protein